MKFCNLTISTLLLGVFSQLAPISSLTWGDWDIDVGDQGETYSQNKFGKGELYGPVGFVWRTERFGDDDYYVHLEQFGRKITTFGEYKSSTTKSRGGLGSKDSIFEYRVRLEWILWTVVSCGCPTEKPFLKTGCSFETPETASDAECLGYGSQEDIVGTWESTGISGPSVEHRATHGTSATYGTSLTTTDSISTTNQISSGITFEGVGNVGTELSSTVSSSISETVSESITTTESTTVVVRCGDPSQSSTGLWHLWQWSLDQADDSSGLGFNSKTANFVCTDSWQKEPLCPVGYCSDLQCQTCLAPFEHLGVLPPSAAPTSAPTAELTFSPSSEPTTSPSVTPSATPSAEPTVDAPTTQSAVSSLSGNGPASSASSVCRVSSAALTAGLLGVVFMIVL